MGKERLEKNLADQMKEAQLKLGYEEETMRFYYPVASLNLLLGTHCRDGQEMLLELRRLFEGSGKSVLGELEFEKAGRDRIGIGVPSEGARYVHEHMGDTGFLEDLIRFFSEPHGKSISDALDVFRAHGDCVLERMPEGADFDGVIYFRDPAVDEYYYCIKEEMGHLIYHRFLKEDYEKLL